MNINAITNNFGNDRTQKKTTTNNTLTQKYAQMHTINIDFNMLSQSNDERNWKHMSYIQQHRPVYSSTHKTISRFYLSFFPFVLYYYLIRVSIYLCIALCIYDEWMSVCAKIYYDIIGAWRAEQTNKNESNWEKKTTKSHTETIDNRTI